jgi:hypothetical protein
VAPVGRVGYLAPAIGAGGNIGQDINRGRASLAAAGDREAVSRRAQFGPDISRCDAGEGRRPGADFGNEPVGVAALGNDDDPVPGVPDAAGDAQSLCQAVDVWSEAEPLNLAVESSDYCSNQPAPRHAANV